MRQHFAGRGVNALWGQRRDRIIAAPGAGLEWSFVLPAGHWYRLLLGTATFTSSAVVANRFPSLQIKDGDGLVRFQSVDAGAIVASKVVVVSYGVDFTTTAGGSGTALTLGLPDVILEAGWSIGSITPNIDVGDTYTAIRLLMEELVDDQPIEAAGHGHHRNEHHELAAHGA